MPLVIISVSSWPARPTKGCAGPVFVGAGGLADEHEPGGRRAVAEDGLGPGRRQVRAARADGDLGRQRREQRGPLRGIGRAGSNPDSPNSEAAGCGFLERPAPGRAGGCGGRADRLNDGLHDL